MVGGLLPNFKLLLVHHKKSREIENKHLETCRAKVDETILCLMNLTKKILNTQSKSWHGNFMLNESDNGKNETVFYMCLVVFLIYSSNLFLWHFIKTIICNMLEIKKEKKKKAGPSPKSLRSSDLSNTKTVIFWDFPGSPVVKDFVFQSRGYRFDPWSGN